MHPSPPTIPPRGGNLQASQLERLPAARRSPRFGAVPALRCKRAATRRAARVARLYRPELDHRAFTKPGVLEVGVGRFLLGFIVAIIVVIFIVVQCAQALF